MSGRISGRSAAPAVAMDYDIFKSINDFTSRHDAIEDVLSFIAKDSQYIFLALLAVLFLLPARWGSPSLRRGAIAGAVAAGIALLVAHGITMLWDRPRPFVAHPHSTHLLISHAADASFPSDHVTGAFAIAVSLVLRNRTIGWLAIAFAFAVAFARVAVGVHYPTDVLGGALIGAAAALLVWQPPIRSRLDWLADEVGGQYERIAGRMLGAPDEQRA
jgi:undecaprenyl-diphosphatase